MLAVGAEHLQGQGEERSPLGIAYIVDLVEDHPLDVLQVLLEFGGCEDEGHRLGGGDEDVRRMTDHLLPLVLRRIAGTYRDADVWHIHPFPGGELLHLGKGVAQIALDVVRQGLERRDVDAVDLLLEGAFVGIFDQLVEDAGEGGEGLSGTGGRRDENALALVDDRDGHGLGLSEGIEPLVEPFGDQRLHQA